MELRLDQSGSPAAWERKIRVEGRFRWAHHRAGWAWAESAIEADLGSPQASIRFVGAVEQALLDSREPLRQPWIGISHQIFALAPGAERLYGRKLPYLDGIWDLFLASLPAYRGLFTLSDTMRCRLAARLGDRVALEALRHPTPLAVPPFRWDRYARDPERRLVQLGHWGRLVHTIYEIEAPSHRKVWLPGPALDEEALRALVAAHVARPSAVSRPGRVCDQEYDRLLGRSLCLVPLFDTSANNSLLECIARATPVLTNPLPAVVEHLGEGYPLYFETVDEASRLAEDEARVREAHLYLKRLPKAGLSRRDFVRRLARSRIYRSLPPGDARVPGSRTAGLGDTPAPRHAPPIGRSRGLAS